MSIIYFYITFIKKSEGDDYRQERFMYSSMKSKNGNPLLHLANRVFKIEWNSVDLNQLKIKVKTSRKLC